MAAGFVWEKAGKVDIDELLAPMAMVVGAIDVPHGGRIERWSLRHGQLGGKAHATFMATLKFPGQGRPLAVEVDMVAGEMLAVVVDKIKQAMATAYGYAIYSEE